MRCRKQIKKAYPK
jgi:hypothetical protein